MLREIAGSLYIHAIKMKDAALCNDRYAQDRALTLRNRAGLTPTGKSYSIRYGNSPAPDSRLTTKSKGV